MGRAPRWRVIPKVQNIDEPLAFEQGTTIDYYEVDGLGSITSLGNTSASIVQTYTYDSYGNLANSTGSVTNTFRYAGREFDSETGLVVLAVRDIIRGIEDFQIVWRESDAN